MVYRIMDGLEVSLIGMTITISMLILLSFCIMLQSKLVAVFSENKRAGRETDGSGAGGSSGTGVSGVGGAGTIGVTSVDDSSVGAGAGSMVSLAQTDYTGGSAQTNAGNISGNNIDDGELVAVLTAAIAAISADDGLPFRIVSYRKTTKGAPAWNLMGRQEYLSEKL